MPFNEIFVSSDISMLSNKVLVYLISMPSESMPSYLRTHMYALQQGLSMIVFLKKKVINFFWLMNALQRGIFIIFGRICMPFSKVLVYLHSSVYPLIRYYNLWTHICMPVNKLLVYLPYYLPMNY